MELTDPVAEQAKGIDASGPRLLAQCLEVFGTLMRMVAELALEISRRPERVTLNSKISSKRPSSGGPGSAWRAQRRASQRKCRVQNSHPGYLPRKGGGSRGRPDQRLLRPRD